MSAVFSVFLFAFSVLFDSCSRLCPVITIWSNSMTDFFLFEVFLQHGCWGCTGQVTVLSLNIKTCKTLFLLRQNSWNLDDKTGDISRRRGCKLILSGFILLNIPADVSFRISSYRSSSLPGYAGDFNLVKYTCQFAVGGEYLLLWGCEGASHAADGGSKRCCCCCCCCSPHHHLTPSQCILATVTLLPHYLRQRSAKLPSSITLFINQMADTSLDNTTHVSVHYLRQQRRVLIGDSWEHKHPFLLSCVAFSHQIASLR